MCRNRDDEHGLPARTLTQCPISIAIVGALETERDGEC
jgi:hypothetical protein